jgi:hypothetical protein
MVSEAEARLIREAWLAGGEQAASAQLRQMFAGLADNAETRASATMIAGWADPRPGKLGMPLRRRYPRGSRPPAP